MSLQVWLPLNGDLKNQGLSDITVTNSGATVNNNGKIGKCYYFGGQNQITFPSQSWMSMKPANHFSVFCWVKGTTTGWLFAEGGWELLLRPTFAKIGLSNNGQYPAQYNYSFDTNTWYHLGFTWSGSTGKLKLYLNGKLVASSDVPSSANFDINNSFKMCYTGGVYLNDFRIYNHALSVKEVKEIAKGLVLHYRLAGPGQENLTKGNNTYERNSASTDGCFWFYGSNFNCKPSTTYTLSIDIDGTISNFHGGSASTDPAKRWASMWLYICKTGTSTNAAGGGYDSPINLNSTNYNFRKIGPTRYAWTYTTPADARSLSIRGNTYSNGTNAIKVKFWNPKIEEGSVATPWCPNPADTLYHTMGYDNNIEYDCAGYQRNGTKSGTITWDIDSPRYTTSYRFNTGSDYIKTNFSATMDELSISFWVKPSSSDGGYSIICSNYNNPSGGLWLATNCEGCSVWAYRYAYMNVSGSLANNVWHHCVYTFKNGVSKWYVNGEEKTLTKNTYTGTAMPITDLTIGNSYTGTSWNTKRYGNLSDFRLYCTALSADDIKALYNDAGYVDKNGNFHAYEFVEG